MIYLVILVSLLAVHFGVPFLLPKGRLIFRYHKLQCSSGSSRPEWLNRPNEEIRIQSRSKGGIEDTPLFDSLYNSEVDPSSETYSISKMTIRDISESYSFSLDFLGDFMVQMGCPPPLDIDTMVGNVLTGDQVYSLLEALNSLDPFETNIDFDSMSVTALANELDIDLKEFMEICSDEGCNLPFGANTILHVSEVKRLRSSYS
jgi:hypothetical protein